MQKEIQEPEKSHEIWGEWRRKGPCRTKEENFLHRRNLGIATFMILEKQENHLPRL